MLLMRLAKGGPAFFMVPTSEQGSCLLRVVFSLPYTQSRELAKRWLPSTFRESRPMSKS